MGLSLAVTGCSESKDAANSSYVSKPNFFDSGTELEWAINDGCLGYKFASPYLKLVLENQASDNELFFMASQMDEAAGDFWTAAQIDEAEGGFQYRRYKNYSYFSTGIANITSNGVNWGPSDNVTHREILKWCSDWSVQIDNQYDGMNSWTPEVRELKDSERKP